MEEKGIIDQILDQAKHMLFAWFKIILAGAGAALIKQGIITDFQWKYMLSGAAALIVTAVWIFIRQKKLKEKILVALGMPENSTVDAFKETLADPKLKEAALAEAPPDPEGKLP